MRRLRVFAALALMGTAGSPVYAQTNYACQIQQVIVSPKQVDVILRSPDCQTRRAPREATGWFAWRIEFPDQAGTSVVLRPDSLSQATALDVAIRNSRPWRCPPPTREEGAAPIRACATPMAGRVTLKSETVRITINDVAFAAALRRDRVARASVTRIEPGGRFALDGIEVMYQER